MYFFVYQQVIIVQKYASTSQIFYFYKTVLSHLKTLFKRTLKLMIFFLHSIKGFHVEISDRINFCKCGCVFIHLTKIHTLQIL